MIAIANSARKLIKGMIFALITFVLILTLSAHSINHWFFHEVGIYFKAIIQCYHHHPVLFLMAYGCIFIVTTLLAIPVTGLLTILGGYIFGIPTTIACVVLTRTSASYLLYKMGRNSQYRRRLRQSGWWPDFKIGRRKFVVLYLMMLRIFPVIPSWSVSVGSGLLRIPSHLFLYTTILGKIPGTWLYAWIGHHSEHWLKTPEQLNHLKWFSWQSTAVWIPIVLITFFSITPIVIKQFKKIKKNKERHVKQEAKA
jgi:uncharacterized membrane protein YdjX (TVP38/TMEM64 family)